MRKRLVAASLAVAAVMPASALAGVSAHATATASRQSRTSDVAIAGADVYIYSSHTSEDSGSGCTLSFAVRSKRTGSKGALTAGHCVATLDGGAPYLVRQTQRLGGNDTAPGDLLGRVTRGDFSLGRNGDNAFVSLAAGASARPLVFTGGSSSRSAMPVAGVVAPQTGMHVCYSGAVTGEHCGFTIRGGSQTVSFRSGRTLVQIGNEWHADGKSCTSRKGDSGSPVYVDDGGVAYAVGILSGGQITAGRCPFYFTPVTVALRAYGLRLLTSGAPAATPVS